jgi:hypothetical protein
MVMAATWILLFYSKITYAVVGGAFMLGLLWFPHARRVALGALATSLAGVLVVELFWSGTVGYLNDIASAVAATGAVRDGVVGLIATVVSNIIGTYLFLAVMLLALLHETRFDYLLMCLFMAAAGILLDRHNSQGPGILTRCARCSDGTATQ